MHWDPVESCYTSVNFSGLFFNLRWTVSSHIAALCSSETCTAKTAWLMWQFACEHAVYENQPMAGGVMAASEVILVGLISMSENINPEWIMLVPMSWLCFENTSWVLWTTTSATQQVDKLMNIFSMHSRVLMRLTQTTVIIEIKPKVVRSWRKHGLWVDKVRTLLYRVEIKHCCLHHWWQNFEVFLKKQLCCVHIKY